MLNLIKSNKIELIAEILAKELIINPPSVTEQIYISLDDYFLSQWIRDQITIKNQISALYEFKTINNFTEYLIKKIYPEYDLDNWNYDVLLWNILESLDEIVKYEESWPLSNWLIKYKQNSKIIDKDIYILCNKIARVFSEYMIFRPEMVNYWHTCDFQKDNLFRGLEKNDFWQALLFKIIENKIGYKSLPYLTIDFINNFDDTTINIRKILPKQIYIISTNNLSKLQISFYLKVSKFTRVNIYQFSYGVDLWNRLNIDNGIIFKKDYEKFQLDNIEKIFGKYGSDFEKLLEETIDSCQIEVNLKPFYSDPEKENPFGKISLLNQLQKKIINNNQNKINFYENDESFYLASHSDTNNQLEFVRDQIINIIQTNKEITYSDIAIACTCLENVIPYIKSIFDDDYINGFKIPYLLANKDYFDISNIFRLLIEYFEIASSKITIEKLSLFLNNYCIKEIFDLSAKDIEEMIKLIEESGFDWGLDSKERSGEFKNTLDWCIQRISLGMIFEDNYFMDKIDISSFKAINNYLDLHKCINVLYKVKKDINSLRGIFNISDWVEKIRNILFTLRDYSSKYNEQINEIISFLNNYLKQVETNHLVDIHVFKDILLNCINRPNNIFLNRNNQIIIGNLKDIRLIPHKVIFLVDVNNNYFPRKFKEENMNLINKFYMFGDSVKINKEKYLFLELLMSCRDKFIISWSNFDKSNNKLEISSPIRQLIYFLEDLLEYKSIKKIIKNIENKKAISNEESKISLGNKYALIHQIEWNSKDYETKNFKLSEIIVWFREPQIFWLRKNNLNLGKRFINNPDAEDINGYQKTKLINSIISNINLDNNKLIDSLRGLNLKNNIIHNGIFAPGNSLFLKEFELKQIIESLIEKINSIGKINRFSFKEDSNKEIYFVSNNKIVELINSNLNIKKLSESWIRLLFASSLNDAIKGTKIIYRLNNQYKELEINSPGFLESKKLLSNYVSIYKNAINTCWPIPPQSSFNFIEAKFAFKNPETAFIKSWLGVDGFKDGERNKPEMIFCFGEESHPDFFIKSKFFIDLSSEIYLPLVSNIKK